MIERHKAGLQNIARHCTGERPLWIVNPHAVTAGR
jgi:hypothetical protein